MNVGDLDGAQIDLAARICPPRAPREQVLAAIALLAGATAIFTARLGDRVDLGDEHWQRWTDITSILMELADRALPGVDQEDCERNGSVLQAALEYGAVMHATGARFRGPEE